MKKIYFILLFGFILRVGMAQEISGRVKNNNTGESLPGVSIVEKGTVNGTTTDANGQYDIQVTNDSAILIFSFIGYATLEEKINNRAKIDIALIPQNLNLNEVVVTALGVKREAKNLGYAIQKLDAKTVSEVKSPNFVDDLAGKIAGVTISQGATGVGSTSKIIIRGEASFSNNNPLFVIDGTFINNNSVINATNDAAAGFQEIDFGNGAMEINADDIASVTVLKGPSAAALYGTRAANGVILVATKDGSKSKGLGISFNSTTFINKPFRLPKFQNKYGQGNSGKFEFVDGLGGGTNDNITYSWGPALDQGLYISQYDSPVTLPDGSVVRGGDVAVRGGIPIPPSPFISHPNNLKNVYRTGATTINNFAISSGFNKGHFRMSYTDLRSESIIPGVNLKRKTLAGRLTFSPVEKLKIATSFNYVNSNSDNRPASGYGSENINYSLVAWGPRSLNTNSLKNYWQPGLEGIQQSSFNYTFFDNPYFILFENRNSFNRDRLFGNISATYDFTKNWNVSFRSGMDYSNELRKFRRAFSTNRFKNGAYAEHKVFFRENNTDVLVNYTKKIGVISVKISAGGNRLDRSALSEQTQAESLAQPGIYNLSNAASPLQIFEIASQKRINSLYGIAKLGYKNLVYVDITGRNDWSSALATPTSTANTSFFYPSISGSFIISNAIKLPHEISFAKLRANWAQVGNDTDPYQTSNSFIAQTAYNSKPTFSAQNTIANTNLSPEKITSVEIGADIRFFNDKLRFDITYYRSITKNQIIALPITISSGFNQQVINGGVVRSQGIEIMAGITPIRKKDFEWNMQFNFSRNVATVTSLPASAKKVTLAYSRIYDNVNQTVWFQVDKGGRIGDMYGTGYLKNEKGNFVIDNNGKYIVDNTLKKLGNYNPDFILGFNNNFSYKNWNLGFLLDWRQGGKIISRTLSLAGVGGQLIETENRPIEGIVADGVVNVGTDQKPVWQQNTQAVSAESYYRQYYDRNHEENNVYSASYVKLRQFSIGYSFKTNKNKGFFQKGRSLSISIIGRNLYAISKTPHFDPEQLAVQGQKIISGVEDMSYATSRSFGIKLGYKF